MDLSSLPVFDVRLVDLVETMIGEPGPRGLLISYSFSNDEWCCGY